MKWQVAFQVAVVNIVLIPLLALITHNYALRLAYWRSEGFTPTMTRYPFFFITSAVKGSTHIPGLFSVDWQQVIAVILFVTDAYFVWSLARSPGQAVATPP